MGPERQWQKKILATDRPCVASGLLSHVEKEVACGRDILKSLTSGKSLRWLISGLERARLKEKV